MKQTTILLLTALLALAALAGCGAAAPAEESDIPPLAVTEQSVSEDGQSVTGEEDESPSGEESPPEEEEDEAPAPLYAHQIEDGVYAIEVSSSSSMFRVVDAQLRVAGDAMSAVLTLSGTGYEKLYLGTGEEALANADDACVYFVEDEQGAYTYEVPVAALDLDIDVAAFSIRRQIWYDRVLVFQSANIPAQAITAGA